MDYLNRTPRLALLALVTSFGIACDKGSLGEFESDTEGGSSSGDSEAGSTSGSSTSPTASSSATSGATTAVTTTEDSDGSTSQATTSATGSSSVTESESDSDSASSGQMVCEQNENWSCDAPLPCLDPDSCGAPYSPFSELGCLRPTCRRHDECGGDELCYHPINYGGCASSNLFCEQDGDLDQCICGGLPDCGGAYCIPAEIYLGGAEAGPSDGLVGNECAPDDGPAVMLRVGLDANACDGEFGGALVTFLLAVPAQTTGIVTLGELDNSAMYSEAGNLVDFEIATSGLVTFFSWENDIVTGEYELTLEDGTTLVNSFAAPYCDNEIACG